MSARKPAAARTRADARRRVWRAALCAAAVAAGAVALGATSASAAEIPGSYIVTLQPGHEAPTRPAGARPEFRYQAALNGFAAELDARQLAALRRDPTVRGIEPDQTVHATAEQTLVGGEPWGLDRIDQPALPLSGTYSYNRNGASTTAYVIDTGIDPSHPEFGGRARNVFDVFGGRGTDCNGHGTHVAGTIGARTYGVAKRVALRGVRVLDCDGSGTVSGVIAGLDWVRTHHAVRAVANLSLGGGLSPALDAAVENLVAANVFVAVAAGNNYGEDACSESPARAPSAYTTAASDGNDQRAWFSDAGPCVDGYAPGVRVLSTVPGGGVAMLSGTSMATPHVTGVAALIKGYANVSPSDVSAEINALAIPDAIGGNLPGTPNRLLNKGDL